MLVIRAGLSPTENEVLRESSVFTSLSYSEKVYGQNGTEEINLVYLTVYLTSSTHCSCMFMEFIPRICSMQ